MKYKKIVEWCSLNCLKLDASKTSVIILGSRQKISSDYCISAQNIIVCDHVILYVKRFNI